MTTTRQPARPRVRIWPDGTRASAIDVSAIVESFSASKSLASPTGQFSLNLLPSMVRGSRSVLHAADYVKLIRTNALVSIGWDRPGGIMLGLVSSVRRAPGYAGSVSDGVQIQGLDFGKVLVSDNIVRAMLTVQDFPGFRSKVQAVVPGNALTDQLAGVWGPDREDGGKTFVQATVKEVVEWVLDATTAIRVPLLTGLGGSVNASVGRYITPVVHGTWNDGRIQNENLWQYNGSIWGFLQSVIDPDFYDLWLDTYAGVSTQQRDVSAQFVDPDTGAPLSGAGGSVDRQVYVGEQWRTVSSTPFAPATEALPVVALNIRPKPYDEPGLARLPTREPTGASWNGLRTALTNQPHHVLPLPEVLGEQMGVSDAEVYSYYNVTSAYDIAGSEIAASMGLYYPTVDLYELARHGVRAKEARLSLMAADVSLRERDTASYTATLGSEVLEFRNRLFNWYHLNEYMESGTVQVLGRDHYRVGDPYFLPWRTPLLGGVRTFSNPRGMRYYGVSVTWSWNYGGTYTTSLSLMRGHNQALLESAGLERDRAGRPLGMPSMIAGVPDLFRDERPKGAR